MKAALEKLIEPKIVIITGKGGVGKSVSSLALAAYASQKGKKTLLVELEGSSYFSYLTGQDLGFSPMSPFSKWPNLSLARWSGLDCLREYVESILKVKSLVGLFLDHPVMKSFIEAAPALSDVSILGKLTSGCRNMKPSLDYDLVILDGYSTGHFLSMMRAPRGLAEAIRVGPMGAQSREIDQVLTDPSLCGYGLVTLPEELPIQEVGELHQALKEEFQVEPTVILNQFLEISEESMKTENGFSSYLKSKKEKQQRALKNLENLGGAAQIQLPLVFEKASEKLISILVNHLKEIDV